MKRMFTLQSVAVSRFSIPSLLILLFLAVALCGPLLRVAHLKTPQKENACAANLAQLDCSILTRPSLTVGLADTYSYLNASIGSSDAALRAG